MTVLCRRFLFLAVAAVLALLSSCSDFNSPVKDYLEEYSGNAAIGYQQFLVPVEKDADGIDSIASDADGVIRFLLRNPRSYVISTSVVMDSGETVTEPEDYIIRQSDDRQSLTLTFTESFLHTHERGGNISAQLNLLDLGYGRVFPSWHFNLRCNTPPPVPYGSRVMLEPSPNDRYVLCFNLDLSNEVQDDIASIEVNGQIYTVDTVQAGSSPVLTFKDENISTKPPEGTLRPVGNLQPFNANLDITQVYLLTHIAQSQAESRFTITVRDTKGLARTAVTSTAGNMLARPTIVNSDNEQPTDNELSLNPDLNGEYAIRLDHAEPGVTLNWTIDGGSRRTSTSLPTTITVTDDCTIEAWASRSGYIDSEHVIVSLTCVRNIIYVDPASGNDSTGNGSETRPFKTITHAVTQFSDPTDEGNTVYLMGDITGREAGATYGCISIEPTGPLTCSIIGNNDSNKTIDCNEESRGIYIEGYNGIVNITLQYLTITKGNTSSFDGNGGGIYFESSISGSSLTLDRCSVTVNQAYVTTATMANGGGIYFRGTTLSVNSSSINNNKAIATSSEACGGGIYANGLGTAPEVIVDSSTIYSNVTNTPSTGSGGGMYVLQATLTLNATNSETRIYGNTGNAQGNGHGGGVFICDGSGSMRENVSIDSNSACTTDRKGTGGGIRLYASISDYTFTVNGGTISNNYAGMYAKSYSAYGGGIYAGGIATCTYHLDINGGTIAGNYASYNNATGFGGGVYAENAAVSVKNAMITNNTASTGGTGSGGGLFLDKATFTMESGSILDNQATTSGNPGYGSGLYVYNNATTRREVTISGGDISHNYANEYSIGKMTNSLGGGVFLSGYLSAKFENAVSITNNTASMKGVGSGGGCYLQGLGALHFLTLYLTGGRIESNTASSDSDGQGGAFYVGPYAKVTSSQDSTVNVNGNMATQSSNPVSGGYGGAFFVSENATVTWSGGTMTRNWGNTQTAAASYGEAFNITGSSMYEATVNLGVGLGANDGTSYNVIHMTQGAALHLQPSVTYRSDNYIYHNGGRVYCEGYLYADTIPLRVLGSYGDTVLDTQNQRALANYYKFKIGDGTQYCINANGKYSQIDTQTANTFDTLVLYANTAPTDGMTRRIICNFSLYNVSNVSDTLSIPTGTHIRIIPSGAVTINPMGGRLISIKNNGHLLIGQLLTSERITFDCNVDDFRRTSELIEINGDGSLVLHNTLVINSFMSISGTYFAPLINQNGGVNCVVLDDFFYEQGDQTISSSRAAFILATDATCHFVGGGITNFRAQNGPGVADLETGSTFYLYPGVTLTGNSLSGGYSISGAGTLDNPSNVPLN